MDPNDEETAPQPSAMRDLTWFDAAQCLAELMGAMRSSSSRGDVPETERSDPPLCVPYMISGRCKFGSSCKNFHPGQDGGSPMSTALNIHGYPLRPGEKNCSYYLKTGQCKFGATCKFHHPLPAGVQVEPPVPGPAPVRPASSGSTQLNGGASPVYGLTQFSPQAPSYPAQYVPVSSFSALSGSSPMFADVPLEVLLDIFIRLPLKSIGRSRCVSKPWLSLLSNYEFIKAHLAHHSRIAQEQKLLLLSSRLSLFSLTPHLAGNDMKDLKFLDEQVTSLVGSCNGLVLVATKGRVMSVVNCMTQEYVKVPASPFGLCPHLSFKKHGFGYDSLSDDYKIVKISQCDYGQSDEPNCPDIFIDTYSLRERSWKRLGAPLYGHDLLNYDNCVFMNGAFHYIGLKFRYSRKQSAVICAFNLSSETYTEIPAPASVNDKYKFLSAKLMVIDGCIGIVVRPYAAQMTEVWLMKVESWTKLVVDIKPLCSYADKILFKDEQDEILKWHCVKDGRVEACLVNDGGVCADEGITYSESLVSPHFHYHQN